MVADTSALFSNTPVENPAGLNGPEFGLLGAGGDPGGLTAIENSLVFSLVLNGIPVLPADYLNRIDQGTVAVTYGSPSGKGVPDGGTTIALFGLSCIGLAGVRRFAGRKKA